MSNNKQSSVDFIHDSLVKYLAFEDIESVKIFDDIIEKAKAMHKEEMIDFAFSWSYDRAERIDIDQDYNETFNNESTN